VSVLTDEQIFGAAAAQLKAAIPKGWMALRPLILDRRLDGREPVETWEMSVQWATDIEGGRTMYYSGKTGTQGSGRRIEVTLRGASIDDLATALRALPTKGLERLTALRWPIDFSIESVIVP